MPNTKSAYHESLDKMKDSMPGAVRRYVRVHDRLKQYHLHFVHRVANEMGRVHAEHSSSCVRVEMKYCLSPLTSGSAEDSAKAPREWGSSGEPIEAFVGSLAWLLYNEYCEAAAGW